jgi:hypothetical protein
MDGTVAQWMERWNGGMMERWNDGTYFILMDAGYEK